MNGEEKERKGVTLTAPGAEAVGSTAIDAVLVERLKEVGIPPDEFPKLEGYVEAWKERGSSEAEAWSLIISVEQWAQARTALTIAICALVISVVIGVCSPLVSIWELSIFLNLSRT